MKEKTSNVLENFILLIIFLVLIQTFLEDLAVLLSLSWDVRKTLIFTGFGFDLFFTIEFIIRFFAALKKGEGTRYFFRGRGWIDLIASLPCFCSARAPL